MTKKEKSARAMQLADMIEYEFGEIFASLGSLEPDEAIRASDVELLVESLRMFAEKIREMMGVGDE